MGMGRKRNCFLAVIFGLFAVFMAFLLSESQPDMIQMDSFDSFDQGWSVTSDEDSAVVTFGRPISEGMLGKAVGFYVYDSFVDAEVDGESIYHFGQSSRFLKSPASLWHLIPIPVDAEGKLLTIRIRYAYEYKFTTDVPMMLGSSGAAVAALLKRELLDLVIDFFMIVLGLVLCGVSCLQAKNGLPGKSSLYLGLLSICFSLFSFTPLFLDQLIFPYGAAQYFAYYFFLFLLPLLLICYLEQIRENLRLTALFWCHVAAGLLAVCLQFSGAAEFTETVSFFLVFSGVEMVVVMFRLLKGKSGQKTDVQAWAFALMLACILANGLLFFLRPAKSVDINLAKLGFSIYLVAVIWESVGRIANGMAQARQSQALRRIAFTDSMTGVGNRYAFNDEIGGVPLKRLSLFSLDINNLKYYNDTYGHACGDALIQEAVKLLGQVFGRLFRTGGDEFIAIETARTPEELAGLKRKLDRLMQEYNDGDPKVRVEIACGFSSCREGDLSYEDILRRADGEMYRDKAERKKISPVKSLR